jgi:hypothetical protein
MAGPASVSFQLLYWRNGESIWKRCEVRQSDFNIGNRETWGITALTALR